jgi:hypothetical protein
VLVIDFVKYDPRVLIRFFWHRSSGTLRGTCEFTDRAEGPPGNSHLPLLLLLHTIRYHAMLFYASRTLLFIHRFHPWRSCNARI